MCQDPGDRNVTTFSKPPTVFELVHQTALTLVGKHTPKGQLPGIEQRLKELLQEAGRRVQDDADVADGVNWLLRDNREINVISLWVKIRLYFGLSRLPFEGGS